jgi:hypothetical protein
VARGLSSRIRSTNFWTTGGLCALLSTLAACGGGGSTAGTIEGLSVGESMSVITTENGSGSPATGGVAPQAVADTSSFAADCDYNTDPQHANVYDPSMKTLQTVNMILCLLSQTGYADLVNEGDYKAQIDEQKCDNGSDGGSNSSAQGQSSGANAVAPNLWVIHSERASNGSDQIVEFWVPQQDDHDGAKTIWVRMVVSEGASATNPFGVFTLNFAAIPDGGTIADATEKGTLATLDVLDGFIGFSFYQQEGDVNAVPAPNTSAKTVQANVNMLADQSQGVAFISEQRREDFGSGDSGLLQTTYAIAFDQDSVLRSQDGVLPGTLLLAHGTSPRALGLRPVRRRERRAHRAELGLRLPHRGRRLRLDRLLRHVDAARRQRRGRRHDHAQRVRRCQRLDLHRGQGARQAGEEHAPDARPHRARERAVQLVVLPGRARRRSTSRVPRRLLPADRHLERDVARVRGPARAGQHRTPRSSATWACTPSRSAARSATSTATRFITFWQQSFVNSSSELFAGGAQVELYGYFRLPALGP